MNADVPLRSGVTFRSGAIEFPHGRRAAPAELLGTVAANAEDDRPAGFSPDFAERRPHGFDRALME